MEPIQSTSARTPGGERLPVRRNINLLTTVKEADESGDLSTRSFGNILELSGEGLLLESAREVEVGARLTLSVVFPGQPRGDDPFARLGCIVRKIQDGPSLQYDLAIDTLDEASRERLTAYLLRPGAGEDA